uniref:VWFA domain-containing protein n=1 Tax=viral metagenome TaxID=1070528 RepID=A0A6C0H3S9_9ZZZZ
MKDPVQGNDGNTYERSAIISALTIKQESPITRQPMRISDLKVNVALRFLCDKYHQTLQSVTTQSSQDRLSKPIILDHAINKNNDKLLLTFNVNKESFPKDLSEGHLSQDIVLVIDRSGSMHSQVEAKDRNGQNLENGLSIQDIVNHSAKTVVQTLDAHSRICIIKFDNVIDIVTPLMYATETNKVQIMTSINSIKPGGQTNIWGAIEKALQILDGREDKSRNSAILMLTDGIPNVSPAQGEVETLKRLRKTKNFTTPIYTFGFGYNLQPTLLYNLAKYSNGGNAHIPDGNMIATVFCNFIATILCSVVMNLQLHITPKQTNSASFNNLLVGDFAYNYDPINQKYIYDIGTVQVQQERNIVLNFEDKLDFTYYYTYTIEGKSYTSSVHSVNADSIAHCVNNPALNSHIYRATSVEYIRKMINANRINNLLSTQTNYDELVKLLEENKCSTSQPFVDGLLKNIKGDFANIGQVKLAIDQKYFRRWGEFYLDQLSRSLNQQIKPNFKDEGCMFGGEVFEALVDKSSDIFNSLEAPTPSLVVQQNSGNMFYRGLNLAPQAPISMASYNDPHGGCVDSYCNIAMFDGTSKLLKDVQKFDIIKSIDENNKIVGAKVLCVLETLIESGSRDYVSINGVLITPWHPIKIGLHGKPETWCFPGELFSTFKFPSSSMITLVLENHHVMFINGLKCITLGHNFTNHSKLIHPYYGTNKVIENLNYYFPEDYAQGKITVKDTHINYKMSNNITESVVYHSQALCVY